MKKNLYLVFVLIIFSLPCFAVITPEEEISQEYVQNHGYSPEMARIMDLQTTQINGTQAVYKGKDPDWYAEKKVNFIRKIFMYFDGGLDDGQFGRNKIEYTNHLNDY